MLLKKLFRTLWQYKAQFISMVIMVALGVGAPWLLYRLGYVTHVLWLPVSALILYILALAEHYVRAARERQALALKEELDVCFDADLDLADEDASLSYSDLSFLLRSYLDLSSAYARRRYGLSYEENGK